MEKIKQCPYCGEEILAAAKKCKYCGEWLKDEVLADSVPNCKPSAPAEREDNHERLENVIRAFMASHQPKSEYVYFLDSVPDDVLTKHKKHYASISPTEKLLLVASSSVFGMLGTGLLITNAAVYYRSIKIKAHFFDWLFPRTVPEIGIIPLKEVRSIRIGEPVVLMNTKGAAHLGQQLLINGEEHGSLRMGNALFPDEIMEDELNHLFNAINHAEDETV